ncbi:helix-turn-helix domain-containing protein [Clostridium omnivorum]|uniref:Transcriptional regulator n=1 Tax=Clostridium omnivorum TaxID=1604902 RepID=A0ABQ5NCF0_9CLOT|nr:helix-turn-helix transcriptional regulator [Clostridium sp. E14]GLC32884.1 transcriptional regulator [Clostridium sp. E14]
MKVFEDEILSPGEKIRKLRILLGATQADIAGEDVTRNLISELERHKNKLSLKTAKAIATNINNYVIKNNIDFERVSDEDLLEDSKVQVNKVIKKLIKKLDNIKLTQKYNEFVNLKDEIDDLICKYETLIDPEFKCNIYKLYSDIYFQFHELEKSEIYALKCYDEALISNNNLILVDVLMTRIKILWRTNREREIVILAKYALYIYEINKLKDALIIKKIYYNMALAYKTIKEQQTCIYWLEKLEQNFMLENKEYCDIKILKANCYLELLEYNKAEKLYLETLELAKKVNNITAITKIYKNLAFSYYKLNDYSKAIEYANIALDIKNNDEEENILTFYYAISIYRKTESTDLVIKNYEKAILRARNYKNDYILLKLIKRVSNYFIDYNVTSEIDNILKLADKYLINRKIVDIELICIFYKATTLYATYDLKKYNYYKEKAFALENILKNK